MSSRPKKGVMMKNLDSQVDDDIIEVEMIVLFRGEGGGYGWDGV